MTTITEDYVSFEIAKLLREKGFNERLLTFYVTDEAKKEGYFQIMAFTDDKIDNNHNDHCYLAPTLQMVMSWLREVKEIFISIYPTETDGICAAIYKYGMTKPCMVMCKRNKHKEACEAAIKYCLENLI